MQASPPSPPASEITNPLGSLPGDERFNLITQSSPAEQVTLLQDIDTYAHIPERLHMQLVELPSFRQALTEGFQLESCSCYYYYPTFVFALSPRALHHITSSEYQQEITLEKNNLARCFNYTGHVFYSSIRSHEPLIRDYLANAPRNIRPFVFALLLKSAEIREEFGEEHDREDSWYARGDIFLSTLPSSVLKKLGTIKDCFGECFMYNGYGDNVSDHISRPDGNSVLDANARKVKNSFVHWFTSAPPFKQSIIDGLAAAPNMQSLTLLAYLEQKRTDYHAQTIDEPETLEKLEHWIGIVICGLTPTQLLTEIERRHPEYAPEIEEKNAHSNELEDDEDDADQDELAPLLPSAGSNGAQVRVTLAGRYQAQRGTSGLPGGEAYAVPPPA